MRVTAAVCLVAEAPDELRDPCILALLAAPIERLDGHDTRERRLAVVVVAETHRRPSRMTGQRDAAEPRDVGDEGLRGKAHVCRPRARSADGGRGSRGPELR